MKCTKCGTDNPANQKFCGECGSKLEKLCPFCHEPVNPSAEFCLHCGEYITNTVEEKASVIAHKDELVLIAAKTCPNCKMASIFLDKAGAAYKKLYVEDNPKQAQTYGVTQTPTLIVQRNDGGFEKIVNVSNIRKYIEQELR